MFREALAAVRRKENLSKNIQHSTPVSSKDRLYLEAEGSHNSLFHQSK